MIDYETARQIVISKWLPHKEEELGWPVVVDDEETEEYEWGWVIYYRPAEPERIPKTVARRGYLPLVVDRSNGLSFPVGTSGLYPAVRKLLGADDPRLERWSEG